VLTGGQKLHAAWVDGGAFGEYVRCRRESRQAATDELIQRSWKASVALFQPAKDATVVFKRNSLRPSLVEHHKPYCRSARRHATSQNSTDNALTKVHRIGFRHPMLASKPSSQLESQFKPPRYPQSESDQCHPALGAPFFTDASELTPAMGGVPTIILGPGETIMAHKTDEYCLIPKIEEAVELYREIALRWPQTET
jgi:hypothetical protein